jgi:uncharacterized membrane protein
MSNVFLDHLTSFAPLITLKASIVLGAAALFQAVMSGRTSAAARHAVWLLAVAGILLLPILSLALPQWTVVTDGTEFIIRLEHPGPAP